MKKRILAAAVAACCTLPVAEAQEWYAGGSIGAVMQSDSDNQGVTGAFVTGNGSPTVPNGTPVAAGTPYGWTTEFDGGWSASAEAGLRYASGLRSGIELAYSKADVDRHSDVRLATIALDNVDAAVVTGSATQLGATVGQVVADGRGELTNFAVFANGYYDFNRAGAFQPYVGAGIGFSQVEVDYSPSGVQIIDGDDTAFAWQLKAGATWRFGEKWEAYGEYAYRQTDDVTFDNQLFPGTLDIENKASILQVGMRYRFG
jgi:opacity protein-like surface antigen